MNESTIIDASIRSSTDIDDSSITTSKIVTKLTVVSDEDTFVLKS